MAAGNVSVEPLDWASMELPDAWPDEATLRRPGTVLAIVRHIFGKRESSWW